MCCAGFCLPHQHAPAAQEFCGHRVRQQPLFLSMLCALHDCGFYAGAPMLHQAALSQQTPVFLEAFQYSDVWDYL